jgi:bifunctional non-homologous end joining protein LigD
LKPRVTKTVAPRTAAPPVRSRGRSAAKKGDTSLRAYRAKRNFKQTSEPRPKRAKAKPSGLLFVIQKHDASHLHYDFRLEMDGVLKSWAVPKGPSTTRGERRLAMHVEDHPMDYAGFEGTIPEGNYGAGTVMVWDFGFYETEQAALPSFHRGKILLRLNGKKLRGTWALVKAGRGDEDNRWFLIKTGEDARPISARRDDQSALTRRSMKRIASENTAQWQSNRSPAK